MSTVVCPVCHGGSTIIEADWDPRDPASGAGIDCYACQGTGLDPQIEHTLEDHDRWTEGAS